jgi:hypothetical protein
MGGSGPQITNNKYSIVYVYKDGHNMIYNKKTGHSFHWTGSAE